MTYTQATGKRPLSDNDRDPPWTWFELGEDAEDLPTEVFVRLLGGKPEYGLSSEETLWCDYPTEAAALAAADAAYLRAVADGAMGPIEGVA